MLIASAVTSVVVATLMIIGVVGYLIDRSG